MSYSTSPLPIQIHIPPSLFHHAIPLSQYLITRPTYTNLAVGAFIFTLSNPPSLLLVQRAATEYAFPNLWEVPGGSSEATDPTILHSVAREVFEETGLHLTRLVCEIGLGVDFETPGGARWKKLSFEIEVEEMGVDGNDGLSVRLDPEEHQASKWVREEEVRDGELKVVTEEQRVIMLQAFVLRNKRMR